MQPVQVDDPHTGAYDERDLLSTELQIFLQTASEQSRLAVGGRSAQPWSAGAGRAHGAGRTLQLRRVLRETRAEQFPLHLEPCQEPGVADELSELLQQVRMDRWRVRQGRVTCSQHVSTKIIRRKNETYTRYSVTGCYACVKENDGPMG